MPIRAHLISSENDNTSTFAHHLSLKLRRRFAPIAIAFLILLTTLIPIAQLPSMLDFSKNCESAYSLSPSLLNEFPDEMRFMKGMVLYPRVQKNQTSFTFLSCGLRVPVVLKGVDIILDDNQKVVMGYYGGQFAQPESFFFLDNAMDMIWSRE